MVFTVPQDSLARRYLEAYRQVTWEGVRGPSGLKVIPDIRTQTGPTCIYDAVAAWMEALLRLMGILCRLSSKDLELKENAMVFKETDRTIRCMEVLKSHGMISEDDFKSQNPNPTTYKLKKTKYFFSLNQVHFPEAITRMKSTPLLTVFHVGVNYYDYITKFLQRPVLSYERYEEGKMEGHAACVIAYGVESIVPFWKFMNSYGKHAPTKGFGRVLPQNVIYLIAPEPGQLVVDGPTPPAPHQLAAPTPLAAQQVAVSTPPVAQELVGEEYPVAASTPPAAQVAASTPPVALQPVTEPLLPVTQEQVGEEHPEAALPQPTNAKRRKRRGRIIKDDTDAPILKKEKVDHGTVMDQDKVLPP